MFALAFASCDNARPVADRSTAQQKERLVTKTDTAGLQRLINLPYAPSSVKWTTTQQAGRDDWSLDALLSLSKGDIGALLSSAERLQGGKAAIPRQYVAEWFPDAARADLQSALETKGDRIPVDAVRITGAPFAAPDKSPVIHGEALVFEKYNLVFVGLYTM